MRFRVAGIGPVVAAALLLAAPARSRAQAGDSTLLVRFCPDSARRDGHGAIVGRVRNTADDAPIAGVTVVLRWDEIGVSRATGRVTLTPQTLSTVSDEQARYRFCAVPRYTPLILQAQAADLNSGAVTLQLADEPIFVRAFSLNLAAPPEVRGTATLMGEVVTATGAPVVGARAQLDGMPGGAVTNDTGVFVLPNLPAGTQSLVVRGIGYLPKRATIELRPGVSSGVTIVLDKTVRMLDSVRVLATRERSVAAWQEALEKRKRASPGGTFLDEERINRQSYFSLADLLRSVRGLSVSTDGVVSLTRGAGSISESVCVPPLIVDGLRMETTVDIVRPWEVRAIEVYRGSSEVPVEFNDPCGAIVIWTKR